MNKYALKKRAFNRTVAIRVSSIIGIIVAIIVLNTANIAPVRMLNGVVWLKGGVHYLSSAQLNERIVLVNSPKEAKNAEYIKTSTPACDSVEAGFCQKSPADYYYKTLVAAATPYVAGTPDRQEVVGYCTLCNDGSFSPSCAVGRGACSYHSGVSAYNVPRYRVIKGTPDTPAREAIYSYTSKQYRDSPAYVAPAELSLKEIVGY